MRRDVTTWTRFALLPPREENHRSPVNSSHAGPVSNVELWYVLVVSLNKLLNKQASCRSFEASRCSLYTTCPRSTFVVEIHVGVFQMNIKSLWWMLTIFLPPPPKICRRHFKIAFPPFRTGSTSCYSCQFLIFHRMTLWKVERLGYCRSLSSPEQRVFGYICEIAPGDDKKHINKKYLTLKVSYYFDMYFFFLSFLYTR